jgi:Fuc2NAc and GlcNAc transferase
MMQDGEATQALALYSWWLLIGLAFVSGIVGTWLIRHYALRRGLLDIPSQRSLHDIPLPRGGGLAIATIILATILLLGLTGSLSLTVFMALFPAAVFVTVIGWIDDHHQLPAGWRALGYLLAAGWFVIWSGGLPEISLGTVKVLTGAGSVSDPGVLVMPAWLVMLMLVIGIAWLTNLYNFMDGTDGLAGLQATLAGCAGGWLFWQQGADSLALICILAAAGTSGFLIWNWPPAKIFMGDVGSCLLGFTFGCLAVLGELLADLPALLWMILLAVFIWDASLTLLMRIIKRERWYSAHRKHAYQRLVQMGLGHGHLIWLFLGFNVLVLWPLTWWSYRQPEYLPAAVITSVLFAGMTWLAVQVYYEKVFTRDKDIVQN